MDFVKRHIPWAGVLALVLLLIGGYRALFAVPTDFPSGIAISITRGMSAPRIAQELDDAHIIRRSSLLLLLLRISGASDSVQAGTYRFENPQNVFAIATRLATGAYGLLPIRLTIPEGTSVREAAAQVAEALPGISTEEFLAAGQPHEGYLFPDTYSFTPDADAPAIVAAMRANFDAKITALSDDIAASGRPLSAIVIMASLIEKEARTMPNKRLVSGILWNRLELDMPLQVDAVFGYIFNRETYSPSFADLKVDSPYNTYLHTGLPPGPINNPGLDSLQAAITPTHTDYLYYLTGNDNLMHYATTYAGHLANQNKYLP